MRQLRFVSVCAVICVALTVGSWRAAAPASDYDPLLNGAKVVWDSLLLQSDSPCWTDAREAVDYALDNFDSWGKDVEFDETYEHWDSHIPFTASKALAALKKTDLSKKHESTLGYDVYPEGGDEEIGVELIDRIESTKKGADKTTTLYFVFAVVHGLSECGAREGKEEDDPFFAHFSMWFQGYYQSTKPSPTPKDPHPRETAAAPDASWSKELKKELPSEGGIDYIGCCKLPKPKTVPGTQNEQPKTTQTPHAGAETRHGHSRKTKRRQNRSETDADAHADAGAEETADTGAAR